MQPFIRNGKTYWGGLHRVLGLVIYDPQRQHHLTDEKVRLYIVEERRMATFVKHIVRANLLPCSRDTWWCPQHEIVMKARHNVQGTWWSHPVAGGTWCTGTPQPTAA